MATRFYQVVMPCEKKQSHFGRTVNMNSCDEIATEVFEERAAICEFSGLMTREQAEAMGKLASDDYRAACEVRAVLEMPTKSRKPYLDLVEVKRGLEAANVLRNAVRDEWTKRKKL